MRKLVVVCLLAIGCSQPKKVVVTETQVEVYDPIQFARGSDQLPDDAGKMITAVATTLSGDPTILKVAVEAHTADDDAASEPERTELGMRRAKAVLDRVVAQGVAAERLEPTTAAGGPARIEFVILKRKSE